MKNSNFQRYIAAGLTAFLVIACSITFYFCFDRFVGIRSFVAKIIAAIMPVIIGVVIAYLLNPFYNILHRNLYETLSRKFKKESTAFRVTRGLSLAGSVLFLILVIYALLAMIIPQLITSVSGIINSIPSYIGQVHNWLIKILEPFPTAKENIMNIYDSFSSGILSWRSENYSSLEDITQYTQYLDDILPSVTDLVSNVSAGVFRVLGFLKNTIIGVIISVYLLAIKATLAAQMKKVLYAVFSKKTANIIVEQFRYANNVMSGFVSGKLLDSLCIGILCFIGCSILRIPYALLVSVIIGITNIVPFFGPFIGAIPCALFVLLISPFKCIVFVVFIVLLQQFDGNILGPKILGNSTGLSSFWVIFSLLFFGGLYGFTGMILGVPAFAVIYHLIDEGTSALLRRKKLSTDTEDYVLLHSIQDDEYERLPDPTLTSERHESDNGYNLYAELAKKLKALGGKIKYYFNGTWVNRVPKKKTKNQDSGDKKP